MKIMRMSVFWVFFCMTGYTHSAPVSSAMSAVHLYSACNESKSNEYAKGFCDGAIDAFSSSIQDWCVPPSVTHGEVKAQVKEELLKSIPSNSLGALEFVSRAIKRKWPCI